MTGSPTPILDRIEKRRREALPERQTANVIPFQRRKQPVWMERRAASVQGQSPFTAIKDTSEWTPEDAA